jgi:hypothetical protein
MKDVVFKCSWRWEDAEKRMQFIDFIIPRLSVCKGFGGLNPRL